MKTVHADIADLGKIKSLCGLKSGLFIWQDIFNIEFDGKLSAEITCERCKTTAQFLGNGYSLTEARTVARKN